MRNHLATDVLENDLLIPMQNYQLSFKENGSKLDSVISFLENTSYMVSFFSNTKMKVSTVSDVNV